VLQQPSVTGISGATLYFKPYTAISAIVTANSPAVISVVLNAYVTFSNDTKMKVTKTVKFQNLPCCATGLTVSNGVWTPKTSNTTTMTGINHLAFSVVDDYFDQQIGASLCLASTDEGNFISWVTASTTTCANSTRDGQPAGSWRLPNIAELGQLDGNQGVYGMSTTSYWSSTNRDAGNAWAWDYKPNIASYWGTGTPDQNIYVLCVRSLE
jgi:hypothetical protein